MKSPILLFISSLFIFSTMSAQDQTDQHMQNGSLLPYHEIPAYPAAYTANTVAARMIDGLGYRYYWATEKLRPADLAYTPGNDGKTAGEVLDHLYGLSKTIVNGAKKLPNIRPSEEKELTWEEKRKATLGNFKMASDILKSAKDGEMEEFDVVFQRGEKKSSFPFWNMINGPIADAIYHTGQIVSYRRSAGNPTNPFVNVFRGKTRTE